MRKSERERGEKPDNWKFPTSPPSVILSDKAIISCHVISLGTPPPPPTRPPPLPPSLFPLLFISLFGRRSSAFYSDTAFFFFPLSYQSRLRLLAHSLSLSLSISLLSCLSLFLSDSVSVSLLPLRTSPPPATFIRTHTRERVCAHTLARTLLFLFSPSLPLLLFPLSLHNHFSSLSSSFLHVVGKMVALSGWRSLFQAFLKTFISLFSWRTGFLFFFSFPTKKGKTFLRYGTFSVTNKQYGTPRSGVWKKK